MERFLTSLIFREMLIKMTLIYNLLPIRLTDIKKIDKSQYWQGSDSKKIYTLE